MPNRSIVITKSIPVCREPKEGCTPRFVSSKDLTATVFDPLGLQPKDSPQIWLSDLQRPKLASYFFNRGLLGAIGIVLAG